MEGVILLENLFNLVTHHILLLLSFRMLQFTIQIFSSIMYLKFLLIVIRISTQKTLMDYILILIKENITQYTETDFVTVCKLTVNKSLG